MRQPEFTQSADRVSVIDRGKLVSDTITHISDTLYTLINERAFIDAHPKPEQVSAFREIYNTDFQKLFGLLTEIPYDERTTTLRSLVPYFSRIIHNLTCVEPDSPLYNDSVLVHDRFCRTLAESSLCADIFSRASGEHVRDEDPATEVHYVNLLSMLNNEYYILNDTTSELVASFGFNIRSLYGSDHILRLLPRYLVGREYLTQCASLAVSDYVTEGSTRSLGCLFYIPVVWGVVETTVFELIGKQYYLDNDLVTKLVQVWGQHFHSHDPDVVLRYFRLDTVMSCLTRTLDTLNYLSQIPIPPNNKVVNSEHGANFLFRNNGLVDFGRYPHRVLLEMIEQHANTKIKFLFVLVARNDYNTALHDTRDEFEAMSEALHRQRITIRFVEVESAREYRLWHIRMLKQYGEGSAVAGITEAHGSEDGISFSDFTGKTDMGGLDIELIQKFSEELPTLSLLYAPGAHLFFDCCLAGTEDGFVHELSKVIPQSLIGSNQTHSVDTLRTGNGGAGNIEIHAQLKSGSEDSTVYYRGGTAVSREEFYRT